MNTQPTATPDTERERHHDDYNGWTEFPGDQSPLPRIFIGPREQLCKQSANVLWQKAQ